MSEQIDWQDISERLRKPFNPDDVEFMAKGKPGPSGKSQVVAYVDARCVQDHLDAVVGAGAWAFEWQPISIDSKGDVSVAKGTLTIHGVAKSDVGTASNFEASLGAVSHALKRAAVQWGIGRYLYDLEKTWIALDNGHISDAALANLRARLPRPDGAAPGRATATPVATERPQQPERTARTSRQPAPAHSDAGRPTAAPADDGKANPWLTVDGYDPLSDMELRAKVKKIGILNMADFETFLRDAQGYRIYDRAAVMATLTIWEGRHADAQARLAAAGAVEG